ncbi:MAG: NADH-quinone oxidoreductase subunit J [Thermofilum sp.]
MSPLSMFEVYVLLAALASLVSAALAVKVKEDFYSAILLGLTGLGVAALIGLLGYTFLAVFHVMVYVGATVTFVVFGVLLVGRGAGFEKRMGVPALAVSALLAAALFLLLSTSKPTRVNIDLSSAASAILGENAVALTLLALSLASLVIAGIAVASEER